MKNGPGNWTWNEILSGESHYLVIMGLGNTRKMSKASKEFSMTNDSPWPFTDAFIPGNWVFHVVLRESPDVSPSCKCEIMSTGRGYAIHS